MRDNNMDAALSAIFEGKFALAKILLSQRAHVDLLDEDCTPLYRVISAFHCEHLDFVEFLLESGADPNHPQHGGSMTVLFLAVGHNLLGAMKLLLKYGANPNLVIGGGTCLHVSAVNPRVEMLQLLLDNGADFSIRDEEGQLPIDVFEEVLAYRISEGQHNPDWKHEARVRQMLTPPKLG